jgi:tetratricopeptide (TPR) repeat protein
MRSPYLLTLIGCVALTAACRHSRGSTEEIPSGPAPVPEQAATPPAPAHDPTRPGRPPPPPRLSPDQRIAQYQQGLNKDPRLAPLHWLLAQAYLDKARGTHDPTYLQKARDAVRASLAIQESFEALRTMQLIENYSHRFESALLWGHKALQAGPGGAAQPDHGVVGSQVEALLGLGRDADARALLPPEGAPLADFDIAAALGNWHLINGPPETAERIFDEAVRLARAGGTVEQVCWAQTQGAGANLDAGRLEPAERRLKEAFATCQREPLFLIHLAELAAARDDPAGALAHYEAVLALGPDPEVHRLAFVAAQEAGNTGRARFHFEHAERGLRWAVDAGEAHTLGALAQLYLDAGVRLDEARGLARKNLEFKRDREAMNTHQALFKGAPEQQRGTR